MEKKLVKFFKKSEQSVIKCNDIATNDINNAVISQEVEKIEKDFMIFFLNLGKSLMKLMRLEQLGTN